jgi:hypothetical protein
MIQRGWLPESPSTGLRAGFAAVREGSAGPAAPLGCYAVVADGLAIEFRWQDGFSPSVCRDWSFGCRSHYWIRKGQVRWATQLSDRDIAACGWAGDLLLTGRVVWSERALKGSTFSRRAAADELGRPSQRARLWVSLN